MAVKSKRLRFEILKRDGFRCRYCGANATATLLHVDHVVPESDGGPDDPVNLVTACAECNGGKSNVSLDTPSLPQPMSTDDLVTQAADIRSYLAAQREVEDARSDVVNWLAERWRQAIGEDPLESFAKRLRDLATRYALSNLCEAMDATGRANIRGNGTTAATKRIRYFYGVLRKMAADEGAGR